MRTARLSGRWPIPRRSIGSLAAPDKCEPSPGGLSPGGYLDAQRIRRLDREPAVHVEVLATPDRLEEVAARVSELSTAPLSGSRSIPT